MGDKVYPRAAQALDAAFPGPNRNKAVARAFGCSIRTAKYLRAGRNWHEGRLAQARALLGDVFDIAFSEPLPIAQYKLKIQELEARLSRLERDIVEMPSTASGLAPPTSISGDGSGRDRETDGLYPPRSD